LDEQGPGNTDTTGMAPSTLRQAVRHRIDCRLYEIDMPFIRVDINRQD
jgi:hypothetical protein